MHVNRNSACLWVCLRLNEINTPAKHLVRQCFGGDLHGLSRPDLRELEFVNVGLDPHRSEVRHCKERVSGIDILASHYFSLNDAAARWRIDRDVKSSRPGTSSINLLFAHSPEFQPFSAGRD